MDYDRNIVITGFMGTGKSKVGLEVARRLGREFLDMDALIEERVGLTIPEIFAQRGEAFFRQQERQLCHELAQRRGLGIATGGGALIPGENLQGLGAGGVRVRLNCDVEAIRGRVLADELGLAADVFDREPLPLDDPLLGRHNVVHSPHNAGRTEDANRQWAEQLAAQFLP